MEKSFGFESAGGESHHSEQPEKKQRTPAEIRMLKERLLFVAKALSDNYKLRLVPGQGWSAGLSEKFQKERMSHPEKPLEELDPELLKPNVMTYPEKHLLEKGEDYIFGVFRHEVGHLRNSDYFSLMRSQEGAHKEGYSPRDLFFIFDT